MVCGYGGRRGLISKGVRWLRSAPWHPKDSGPGATQGKPAHDMQRASAVSHASTHVALHPPEQLEARRVGHELGEHAQGVQAKRALAAS